MKKTTNLPSFGFYILSLTTIKQFFLSLKKKFYIFIERKKAKATGTLSRLMPNIYTLHANTSVQVYVLYTHIYDTHIYIYIIHIYTYRRTQNFWLGYADTVTWYSRRVGVNINVANGKWTRVAQKKYSTQRRASPTKRVIIK